jgi:choline dehydrogenase-like flavoprotein
MNRPAFLTAVAAVALAAVSEAACPTAAVHPETAKLVQMGAGGQANARAYQAAISAPKTACETAGKDVKVSLSFQVNAELSPGVEARPVKAPYFVVVMAGDKIVAKEVFPVSLAFGPSAATLSLTETVDKISLPLRPGGYDILVGFQLSPDQLRAAQN